MKEFTAEEVQKPDGTEINDVPEDVKISRVLDPAKQKLEDVKMCEFVCKKFILAGKEHAELSEKEIDALPKLINNFLSSYRAEV